MHDSRRTASPLIMHISVVSQFEFRVLLVCGRRAKATHLQIQAIDEGLDETDRAFRPDIIIDCFRKKQHL